MNRHLRTDYAEKAAEYRKSRKLILLAGLRGSGKTRIMGTLLRNMREEKPPVRIVQVDGENGIENGRQLLETARSLGVGPSALFLDNADRIEDLCDALGTIRRNYTVTIFVTGKRTVPLERTLEEAFGGELGIIRIKPFSYPEFLDAFELKDSRVALERYALSGGLPVPGLHMESVDLRSFLHMRANSFILTEIVEPKAIRNPAHLRLMLELVAQSAGEVLSARTVSSALSARRVTISPQAVLDYLEFCTESGLLIPLRVLDIGRKKTVDSGLVWYFADAGLRSAFVTRESAADFDRALENLVFLRLESDGWKILQGRTDMDSRMKETVDFVCEKDDRRIYLQTTGNAAPYGEKLRKRNALLSIRDAWPKYIADAEGALSDGSEAGGRDGIQILFVRDLLLGKYRL